MDSMLPIKQQAHSAACVIHMQELSQEQFVELFERPRVPTVLTGLTDGWSARDRWTEQALLERYRHHRFKVSMAWPHQGLLLPSGKSLKESPEESQKASKQSCHWLIACLSMYWPASDVLLLKS